MQDPEVTFVADLTALKVAFEVHRESESKWQDGIDAKLDHLDQCIDAKFQKLEALISPISRELQEDSQTLFGVSPEKDNGLNSDVKKLKAWKEIVDGRWMKAVAIMFAIQLLFNGAVFILAKTGYFAPQNTQQTVSAQQKPGQP